MLSYEGLGADTAPLWSMSTGGCSGGDFDTQCRPYSGSAGKAYNCTGCGAPNQATIQTFQQAMVNLVALFNAQAQFGVGKTVVADKVIGLNTARAVGILGSMVQAKGLQPSAVLGDVIAMCNAQQVGFERKDVGNVRVQQAIQAVAKHVPALLEFFSAALMKFSGQVIPTPPTIPNPPTPDVPTPTTPPTPGVPILDVGSGLTARRRGMMFGSMLILGITLTMGFASRSHRRRGDH